MFRLMFCVLIALVLAACDQSDPEATIQTTAASATEANPNQATAATKSSAETSAPLAELASPGQLVFEETTADFGRLTENEERTRRLSFRNAGGTTLRIVDLKGTCGCTIPQMPKRVWAPGEEGELTVTFDPSGEGEQL